MSTATVGVSASGGATSETDGPRGPEERGRRTSNTRSARSVRRVSSARSALDDPDPGVRGEGGDGIISRSDHFSRCDETEGENCLKRRKKAHVAASRIDQAHRSRRKTSAFNPMVLIQNTFFLPFNFTVDYIIPLSKMDVL